MLVGAQPARQGDGVGGVALGAQTQRLQAQEQLLGGERIQRGAEVAQDLDAHADRKRNAPERLPELQPVVALRRLDELREPRRVRAPVELAAVHDHPANRRAVSADPFGGAVHDDVGAVLDGAAEVAACAEGVVYLFRFLAALSEGTWGREEGGGGGARAYDERNSLGMGNRSNGLEVRHVVARVPDGLDVDGLGAVVDGGGDGGRVVALDELGGDAEAREEHLELVVGAAVQIAGGHDVVAGVGERRDGHELGGLARGGGHSGDAALQGGDALFKDVDCGLHCPSLVVQLIRLVVGSVRS